MERALRRRCGHFPPPPLKRLDQPLGIQPALRPAIEEQGPRAMAQRAQPREACRENIKAALHADSAHRIGFAPAVPQRALANIIGSDDREALPRKPMQVE